EKGIRDAVTNADQESEEKIISIIKNQFPDHSILAEESGIDKGANSQIVWIIDPLDGTQNFLHGIPYFCVSIGIQENGELMHGVVYNPVLNEIFYASKGMGAFLNEEPIKIANCPNLQNALLATHFAVFSTK